MKSKKHLLALFILVNLAINSSFISLYASSTDKDTVFIRKCKDFTITGDGSSEVWDSTEWIILKPQGNVRDGYETKAKVLYSDKGMYFLFSCGDRKLVSSMDKDFMDLWNEDVVELFLWTDENYPVYFEYELSPLNHELPIIIPNFNGRFLGWLPWHYEGDRKTVHETVIRGGEKKNGSEITGWSAEIFIPYKLLMPLDNVPPVSGTKWRANLYRIDYDNGAASFAWQKVPGTFHDYRKFGTFIFE